MPFYEKSATKGGFENGIRSVLEAILASPYFIFRLEREVETLRVRIDGGPMYRVADDDLASRLSFFLWGAPPDEELLNAASRGELSKVGGLEKQAQARAH